MRTVFFDYPLELAGYQVRCLVPGNPDVLAGTPVLGIPFSVGIPIYSLQRIENPVRGKDTFLVGQSMWGYHGFHGWFENFAVCLQFPRLPFLGFVFPIEVEWSDPD